MDEGETKGRIWEEKMKGNFSEDEKRIILKKSSSYNQKQTKNPKTYHCLQWTSKCQSKFLKKPRFLPY